ncbi:5-(carboxyamino)imidazole ribonucleotide mutase [Lactococcus nasutitermitis]|uniref:N5-carboxyaminoimidazole ribonucleotide mutase n=1 Tax=Lactococcus nasutitermitis TaxID=1652957 RepID=A0ABV9JDH1_9LACT|nr:5-(carboxyamino)imidazole ribonucleotide mutase [Lactococcus nasutitermitis]
MAELAIIMGSSSDWTTMKCAADLLDDFGVEYDKKVVSAHRTPELMAEFAHGARAAGYKVIIAGAGGAAHLPGMVAAQTTVPVIGVPVKSRALSGLDSLYSIVQMPAGVPVATMAIGESGAKNAALFAVQMLAVHDEALHKKLIDYREAAKKMVEISNGQLI